MKPRSINLYGLLWAALLSTSWLLPSFTPLWPSFDLEFAASIGAALLLFGSVILIRGRWPMPKSAAFCLACATVPLLQFATGKIVFFGDAWMSSLYLCGFALAIMAGYQATRFAAWPTALLLGIALAGILSVAIAFQQWIGSNLLEDFSREAPLESRPFANIGQPNNLATLLCLALISIWFGFLTKRVAGIATLGLATLLLFGLALTQSRTGWLIVGSFLLAAALLREPLQCRRDWKWLVGLAVVFGLFVFMATAVHPRGTVAGSGIAERFSSGLRLSHWNAMVAAIKMEPLTGWGWSQVSVAQQTVAPALPPTPELLGYSHNILLDLLIWNGVPIGMIIVGAIVAWHIKSLKHISSETDALLYLAVVAVSIHSLLEYPHAYAYFLLPIGIIVGTLDSRFATIPLFNLPRVAVMIAAGLVTCAVGATAVEYERARSNYDALRFARARIGTARDIPPPELHLLTQLRALALVDRIKIRADADATQVRLLGITSKRYPSQRTLMDYAVVAAGVGDTSAARTSLVRLCKLYPEDTCLDAAKLWKAWGDGPYPWVRNVAFPFEASVP